MSILDVWEKKATAFTRKTKEKTVALTETTRLKSLISGEEKNYRSLCTQVGEEYVKLHKDDTETEFPELMQLCRESLERSEGYERQILQVRKLRACPACGEKVPLDFAFCNYCGAKLPPVEIEPEPGFRKCCSCGAVIPDTMKFCRHCGAQQPLKEEAPVPEEPEAFTVDPIGETVPADEAFPAETVEPESGTAAEREDPDSAAPAAPEALTPEEIKDLEATLEKAFPESSAAVTIEDLPETTQAVPIPDISDPGPLDCEPAEVPAEEPEPQESAEVSPEAPAEPQSGEAYTAPEAL